MQGFDNGCGCIKGETPRARYSRYWYNRLWDFCIAVRKFDGRPFGGARPAMNSDYLNGILFTRGYANFTRDSTGTVYAVECSISGYNYYRYPTETLTVNPYIKERIKGVIGENAIFIRNNKYARPLVNTIKYYAEQLGEIQTSMMTNMFSCRSALVFRAEDGNDANKIRRMIDDIKIGNPAIITDDNIAAKLFADGDRLPLIGTPVEYLVDKYLQNIRTVLNEFLTVMGIDSSAANMIKAERNTDDEVHANDEEIAVNRAFWLEPCEMAVEQANELFGLDMTVQYVTKGALDDDQRESADESSDDTGGSDV